MRVVKNYEIEVILQHNNKKNIELNGKREDSYIFET